ncbi:hypothetical protein SeMB42_g05199 [Synchytrium endobioticum]|uniref:5'-Nucleotidase C-terminal domain-containing protein n=1 Tax=Synchytrium endobioticum TaxID=286115 RepID=A0A507CSZ2_9FUNG|nr:hypothetical protein SeLEV6574_g07697 [Synchytrium endobioticum]TPX42273.1 hypothetical protein SeMB42_g05199 [Synchytrium endobioticum]
MYGTRAGTGNQGTVCKPYIDPPSVLCFYGDLEGKHNVKRSIVSTTLLVFAIASISALSVGIGLGVSMFLKSRSSARAGAFSLTILHTNDIHSHFDAISPTGSSCSASDIATNQCYGGYSRIATVIKRFRSVSGLNTILFDAGDQFQGTLFFNVWGGSIIAQTMNKLGYEIMTIGNHEFDRGEEYAADFFKNLSFPVVSSNFDYSTAPHLSKVIQPYVILEKYGQKIGVVGFITNTTADITTGGRNITFHNPVIPVQNAINSIRSQGVTKIIGVSHNGYIDDQYLAANTFGLSVIVGGHSHSLLSKNRSLTGWEGLYPTAVKNLNGAYTYVVQAHRYGDYFGVVNVTWDANDVLTDVQGDPILLDNTIPADTEMGDLIAEWRDGFANLTSTVIANVLEPGYTIENCRLTECAAGDMVCDAMLASRRGLGAQICVNNGGVLRAGLGPGNVTVGDVLNVLPFGSVLADITYTGEQVRLLVESAIYGINFATNKTVITKPQWAGIRFQVDPTKPPYKRAVNITVLDSYPATSYSSLNPDATYTLVTNDYLAGGGDNILLGRVSYAPGDLMSDATITYLKGLGTVSPVVDGRAYTNVTRDGNGDSLSTLLDQIS